MRTFIAALALVATIVGIVILLCSHDVGKPVAIIVAGVVVYLAADPVRHAEDNGD